MYGIGPLPLTDIFRISKMLNVSNHQKAFLAKKAENQKVILAKKSFLAENRNGILALPFLKNINLIMIYEHIFLWYLNLGGKKELGISSKMALV